MSKASTPDYTVGQVLYYLPAATNRHGRMNQHKPQELTITAIGRRWLTVRPGLFNATGRIDRHTLAADGGDTGSPGRCFRTEQARDEVIEVDRLWSHLTSNMPLRPPPICDTHALRRVLILLGIEQPPPRPRIIPDRPSSHGNTESHR